MGMANKKKVMFNITEKDLKLIDDARKKEERSRASFLRIAAMKHVKEVLNIK